MGEGSSCLKELTLKILLLGDFEWRVLVFNEVQMVFEKLVHHDKNRILREAMNISYLVKSKNSGNIIRPPKYWKYWNRIACVCFLSHWEAGGLYMTMAARLSVGWLIALKFGDKNDVDETLQFQ